jgi:ribonuclease P/MRP protein subunit RPP1
MKFYDYGILADSDIEAISKKGALLGFGGLGLLSGQAAGKTPGKGKIDLVKGTLIETDKANGVKKMVAGKRERFEIVAVRGLNEETIRAAVETPGIDILLPGEGAKIDYVMVKLARKNNVAIGFEFRLLLQSSGEERSRIFSWLRETAKLVKKFGAPFVLTSGAMSEWDLRSPSELTAFGKVLGFEESEIRKSLSGKIVENVRKRLGKKWVMPGVEVE